MTTKVLNLYAGLGGNRRLWTDVDVTAVEWNQRVAFAYGAFFKDDLVIVADAHQYLLENFMKYDFIWSSPPCPTHSRITYHYRQDNPVYPDMRLYEEIILMNHFNTKGKWCIENVMSYYDPLIKPQKLQRHYFWANFNISKIKVENDGIGSGKKGDSASLEELEEKFGFDLSRLDLNKTEKELMLRNCVDPHLGKEIFDCAMQTKQRGLI